MKIVLSVLFFSVYIISNQLPCQYKLENGTQVNTDEKDPFEESDSEEEKRQSCYSLSHSDIFQNKCCYYNKKCYEGSDNPINDTDTNCPKFSEIYNNCGMAGVYQPILEKTCTEISLVQGYCCYVNFTGGSSACIRTKELQKEKNKITSDIENYIGRIKEKEKEKESLSVLQVVCKGYNLKYYMMFIILSIISLC